MVIKGNWGVRDEKQIRALIAKKKELKANIENRDIFELTPDPYALINEQIIDLVMKMLTVDPKNINLQHPFFYNVEDLFRLLIELLIKVKH